MQRMGLAPGRPAALSACELREPYARIREVAGDSGSRTAAPRAKAKDRPGAGAGIARVVNPKMAGALLNTATPPMAPAQRRRIVHAISERSPVLDA